MANQVATSPDPERLLLAEAIAYGPDYVSLRRGPWKLLAHRQGKPLALFQIISDPEEKNDRLASEPEIVEDLLAVLKDWRTSGSGATGENNNQESDGGKSWDDMDDTIRQRLKDLGYSD